MLGIIFITMKMYAVFFLTILSKGSMHNIKNYWFPLRALWSSMTNFHVLKRFPIFMIIYDLNQCISHISLPGTICIKGPLR